MNEKQIIKILADFDGRLAQIEKLFATQKVPVKSIGSKQRTLREIVKGRKFNNGQEQIAVIVGYHENIIKVPIQKDNIKTEWINAKLPNKYDNKTLSRTKDVLIRIDSEGSCDLTQTGEDFFEKFLQNESTNSTSK